MQVLVDCAGARMGGARRFLDELHRWLKNGSDAPIHLIGSHTSVTAGHLLARELRALDRTYDRLVALNNIGWIAGRAERWVLLRNALHFMLPSDRPNLPEPVARRLRIEARMIRYAAKRAHVVVAPSSAMADRVLHNLPMIADRIVVAHHPVTPRRSHENVPGLVVCPVLFAPYKHMAGHLERLCAAVRKLPSADQARIDIRVTATERELADINPVDRDLLSPIGRISTEALNELLARAQVIFYPPRLESFGYPLAEARVNGQPVVAPDTPQNREIAGVALVGYRRATPECIAGALHDALNSPAPEPDPEPFCPERYFQRWLL